MSYRFWRRILPVVVLMLASGSLDALPAPAQETPPYWPTEGWRATTPEEQGMDSARLVAMFDAIEKADYKLHSVLIVRNGYLVTEAYHFLYDQDTPHNIYSCTKSVTSALIGIAIQQGYIAGVDQRMLDYFQERTVANLDDGKQSITLDHLLTMSGGFDWPGGILEPILGEWIGSDDWVQFVLDRPLSDPPGTRFVYNTGGSHLLSAILQTTTGMTALEFAQQNLFEPLGISTDRWTVDPQGINFGGAWLWLTPPDMAKFGYLYLNGGQWDGQQVVPADWVATSTREHIRAGDQWLSDGYGYQWWIDKAGYYMALGYGGQYIIVVPDQDLVVVFTSGLPVQDFFAPKALLDTFILPAVQSSAALPANPQAAADLEARILTFAHTEASAVPPLPETARRVSGQVYTFDPGDEDWESLRLDFADGADTAQVTVDGKPLIVGLDGVLRLNDAPRPPLGGTNAPLAARGAWKSDGLFVIDIQPVGAAESYTLTLAFDDAEVRVRLKENVTGRGDSSKASLRG
jgi:CubicO group peptidase (beta-lactamase class C family)